MDNTDILPVGPALTRDSVGFFKFFKFLCFCVYQFFFMSVSFFVCLKSVFKVFRSYYNYWITQHSYVNFSSRQELKKARTSISKCLMPKIMGVWGNAARVCIWTVSSATMIISVYFIRPGCSVVVLWNLYFCLFSHLSVSLPFWLFACG